MGKIDNLVTIKLDKERHLVLKLRGMLEFQKLTGKSFFRGFKLKDLDLEDMAVMLWACLIDEDKKLTYEQVLDMVDFNNLEAVMDALKNCLTQDLPETKVGGRPLAKTSRAG